jgi:hypothetical protein
MKDKFGNTILILFIIFLTLKLTNIIDWSWWLVTSPLWLPFVIIISIILFIFVTLLLCSMTFNISKRLFYYKKKNY